MVMAEYLAFEILTLLASYFSTAHVAAQSVVSTAASLAFQIPFAISIGCSTRVANLIGAGLQDAAKTAAYTGIVVSAFQGAFNAIVMFSIKSHLPKLFTSDSQVIGQVITSLVLVYISLTLCRARGTSFASCCDFSAFRWPGISSSRNTTRTGTAVHWGLGKSHCVLCHCFAIVMCSRIPVALGSIGPVVWCLPRLVLSGLGHGLLCVQVGLAKG